MSNTALIRESYAAFHRGDIDAALAIFAPEIEWTHPEGMNDYGLGGTKKGHDEVRAFMARARNVFSTLRPEPDEFLESGDRVVVIGVHHMRGAESGVSGTVPFVHCWRLRNGQATHFDDVHDTAAVRRIVAPEPAMALGPAMAPEAAIAPGTAEEDDPIGRVIQLGLGFWPAKVLLSAVELNVFGVLAGEPLDLPTAAQRLGLHPRGARDFLDTLVALRLLEREAGRYRDTPDSAALLDPGKPTYVGGLLEIANELWYRTWGDLTTALRTGQPQNNAVDGVSDPFDVLYADPARMRRFQRAMTGGAMGSINALATRLPWHTFQTVVDVGCAEGALLSRLLSRYPNLTGIGFDLPPVEPTFISTASEFGLTDRMRFVPGSFFTDPLPTADVLVYGHVLHDWDLDTKKMLLRKAFDALPPGGLLVIYEALIDDERRHNAFGLLMSLHMLLESPGGFDYTGADCLAWLAEAGFRDCQTTHLIGPESMVVGRKPLDAAATATTP